MERKTITDEQKTKLLKAIDQATGPGACEYLATDTQPGCVIGQLAVLEGVTLSQLTAWAGTRVDSLVYSEKTGTSKLEHYPLGILCSLQSLWDSSSEELAEMSKGYMRQRVEGWNQRQDLEELEQLESELS